MEHDLVSRMLVLLQRLTSLKWPYAVLACLILGGCAPSDLAVQLHFKVEGAAEPLRLQFYAHNFALIDERGDAHPVELGNVSPWQSSHLALLDLSSVEAPRRALVEGRAPHATYTGIRFVVGVPFDLNHANQLTSAAPLDRPELFWSWQTGYKFWRFDLTGGSNPGAFHLGSTGCSSASALRPPGEACGQPNLIYVELKGFDPLREPIRVRASELIETLSTAEAGACTGNYEQPTCARAFELTGLDPLTGLCSGPVNASQRCGGQRLFAIR